MPRFMDFHDDLKLPAEAIEQIAEATRADATDEFGVRPIGLYHNAAGKVYCLLDATWEEFERVIYGVPEKAGLDLLIGQKLPLHFAAARVGQPDGNDVAGLLLPLGEIRVAGVTNATTHFLREPHDHGDAVASGSELAPPLPPGGFPPSIAHAGRTQGRAPRVAARYLRTLDHESCEDQAAPIGRMATTDA